MTYHLSVNNKNITGTIHLPSSKSESNRLLIIRALCKQAFLINNLSEAQDTKILDELLKNQQAELYDVGAAGTTMRFLTAYFATQGGTRVITGSARMKQRPIKLLVDALKQLGVDITYTEQDGYPPVKIKAGTITGNEVTIPGNVSSQYISALLMIAPVLPKGMVINFTSEITSRPYINMTLELMQAFGINYQWEANVLSIQPQDYVPANKTISVESDWSAASYWYAIVAMANDASVTLKGLRRNSLQGDAVVAQLFEQFGIVTTFLADTVQLSKTNTAATRFEADFTHCPDIAQTLAVVVAAKGIKGIFRGVKSLRIKETERVKAVKEELAKFNVQVVEINEDEFHIDPQSSLINSATPVTIATYHDHRMAMAFAPLALLRANISIADPEVVVKSYPAFWKDLESVGFRIGE